MRIPNSLADEFSIKLNSIHGSASQLFVNAISKLVEMQDVDVMLGDATVTQHDTFEPQRVAMFYEMLGRQLEGWSSEGILKTDTDSLRRLHVQFNTSVGRYNLSAYLAIQYHSIPFYKCDKAVIEIKKHIVELDEKVAQLKPIVEGRENALLEEEMKKRGKHDLSFEQMLETMYNDEKLFSELEVKVDGIRSAYPEYYQAPGQKDQLLAELDDLVVELYEMKPMLLDHNRLMQGEEGAAIYFDLETVNRGQKIGDISVDKIPLPAKEAIICKCREFEEALKVAGKCKGKGNIY